MKFNNRENEHVVLQDGREAWLSRSIAVVASVWTVFEGSSYVLMGKRGPGLPDEVGKWCMPCGYLDWDETLQEATKREVFEETGLDLDDVLENNIVVIDLLDEPWRIKSVPDGKQNVSIHFGIVFLAIDEFPSISILHCEDEEVEEVRWVPAEEVKDLDCAFNHDEVIQEFLSIYTVE